MSVTRVDILVVVAALGVVIFVALLPSPRDNNPAVPDDPAHRGSRSERDCLQCHANGAAQALPERHPPRTDCFRCHRGLAEGEVHHPSGALIGRSDGAELSNELVTRRGVNGEGARDGTHAAATRR